MKNQRKGPKTAWAAQSALLPMGMVVLIAYVASILWTVRISFNSSKMLPKSDWAGITQYVRLFTNERWTIDMVHMVQFGVFFISSALILGFLLAVFVDQKVRLEGVFRTIYLYSYAISFVACGVVWQWMFNPTLGIQRSLQSWGWESARFDWNASQDMAIYCVVIALLWH